MVGQGQIYSLGSMNAVRLAGALGSSGSSRVIRAL
jgi:hypothetical protein